MLEPVRAAADLVIDTSDLNVHQLKERIDHAFDTTAGSRLQVAVESFGFKHGLPLDADIVMDVRFLPNPHWEDDLRPLTGHDPMVRDFVLETRRRLRLPRPVRRAAGDAPAAVPGRGQELPDGGHRLHRWPSPLGGRRRGARRAAAPAWRRRARRASRRLALT